MKHSHETQDKIKVGQKFTLSMGLPTHDLIVQLTVRLLDRSKSLVPVMDNPPQRLDLMTGARKSLVPRSDGLL
jgi:hypothetical protein